jgi:4-hydroxy-tetrahydrodipicolinate reductase
MKIAIAGSTGRMGQALLKALAASSHTRVAEGARDAAALFKDADAVIDFTSPAHTLALAAAAGNKIHVIGTTGLSDAEQEKIRAAAKTARIVQSANFSLGVNALEAMVEKTAALLDEDYHIEIDEMHHAKKKDAPSGTALMLGRAAAKGRGLDFSKARRDSAEGERKRGSIGISARRGGDVVGVHTVTFAGPGENLELTHRAFSRDIYALGALKAAEWAKGRKPGLYSLRDVLGL